MRDWEEFKRNWEKLGPIESQFAILVGAYRRQTSLEAGRQDVFDRFERSEAWNKDINGCFAEFGVSKFFNVDWSGARPGQIHLPDVGPLEVRSKLQDNERLVITGRDLFKKGPDSIWISVYVDVVGPMETRLHLCGWLRGYEAPKVGSDERNKAKPNIPRWFISNELLHPMSYLKGFGHDPFKGIKKGPPLRVAASENPHPTQAKFTQVSPIRSRA